MKKSDISDLIKQVKSANKARHIQKITPVKALNKAEIQFSFYIEKKLLKSVKLKALENEVSIKLIINSALKSYLENEK